MARTSVCTFLKTVFGTAFLVASAGCGPGGSGSSQNVFTTNRLAQFESASGTVAEGSGALRVVVLLSSSAGQDVVVPYSFGGTATPGTDFLAGPNPLVIPAGQSSGEIVVTLLDDPTDEDAETALLVLGAPTNANLGSRGTHSLRIEDDDAPPLVEFGLPNQSLSEGSPSASVAVELSTPSAKEVTIEFDVTGSATSPDDYTIDASPLVIPAGQAGGSITIALVGDSIQEASETIELSIANATNATPSGNVTHTATIQDDDGAPSVGFSVPRQDVDEDAGTLVLPLQLFALSGLDVTVPFTVTGSALDPEDYTISTSPAVIPAGSLSADIVLTLVDDALDEALESVEVTLGTPTNADLASITVNRTDILDDDPTPSVVFKTASQALNESAAPVVLTLELSAPSALAVSVPIAAAGTATQGVDYGFGPNPVSIPAGQTTADLTITPISDTLDENDETIQLTMGTPTNAVVGALGTHVATLQDDDPPPQVRFTVAAQNQPEGVGTFTIGVTLNTPSGLDVSVPFAVRGSATNPDDYTIAAGPVAIPAGQQTANVLVTVADDALLELDETVVVTLGTPTNATLGATTTHTATIIDDDVIPKVRWTAANQSASETAGPLTATVSLTALSGLDVIVPYTLGGTATSADYSISPNPIVIPAGRVTADVTILLVNDALDEDPETIEITLGQRTNADLGAVVTHVVTIQDDDGAPIVQFTQANQAAAEGSGATSATLQLSAPSGLPVTIPYTLAGSAESGVDYTIDPGPAVIAAGATSIQIAVTPIDDSLDEADEIARINLGTPTNAVLGPTSSHAVAIQDDDPLPAVQLASATIGVGEGGANLVLAVELSSVSGRDVSVPVVLTPGTATSPADYGSVPSPLTIAAGQLSADVVVPIVDDAVDEPNETFGISLGTPVNATLGAIAASTATIFDDDGAPVVQFGSGTASVAEGATAVSLTLTLSAASGQNVVVPIAAMDQTATAADYGPVPAMAVIPAGSTSIAFGVPIVDDALDEAVETFRLTLGQPTNADLGSVLASVVSIQDDDPAPSVAFTTAAQNVPENGGATTATLRLSTLSGRPISVPFSARGSATSGADYTLSASPVQIPAGQLTAPVTITPVDDAQDELPETVVLGLGTPTNATLGATTMHTATIVDDDTAPVVSLSAASQAVGEGAGQVVVGVVLDVASGLDVSVPFSLGGGTATATADYGSATSPVVIPAGQTTATITVPIVADTLDEANEDFRVTLGTPANATLGSPSQQLVTITDDDAPPVVAFSAAASSVSEGGGAAVLTVALSTISGRDVTVPVAGANGTAGAADYGPVPSPVVIPAGVLSIGLAVPIAADAIDEGDETFQVTLGAPTNATLGTPATHTVTITDDDGAPMVEFAATGQTIGEGAGPAMVTVALSAPSGQAVTVPFTFGGGTATTPEDYGTIAGPAVIPAGSVSTTFAVPIVSDVLDEADEFFRVNLGVPTNAVLGQTTIHTITIADDDAPPVVAFSAASQSVGEAAGAASAAVALSAVSGRDVSVPFTLVAGSATSPQDYGTATSPVVIPAGSSSVPISVPIVADTLDELAETFQIQLGAPTNATLGAPATHTVTIQDDDASPTVQLSAAAQSVGEADGAVQVTVQLSSASGIAVSVPFTLVPGTAGSPQDYGSATSPVVFAPGTTSLVVAVPIVDDTLDEGPETFALTLGTPANATLGATTSQTVTIVDDDGAPNVSFTLAMSDVPEGNTAAQLTLQLSAASGQTVSVPFALANGTATSPQDYGNAASPVVIPPGLTTIGLAIPIVDDALDEANETFTVTLGTPTNAGLGATTVHTVTILDDDAAPLVRFMNAASSATEGGGSAPVTVELSTASGLQVSVPVTATAGTAGAPADYGAVASPAVIPAGSTSVVVSVPLVDDALDELDETFGLTLGTPTNGTLGVPVSHTVTIVDDDPVPLVDLSAATASVGEAAGSVIATVVLSEPSALAVSVPFTLTPGTATSPADYGSASSPVVVPAGATSVGISIPIVDDALDEPAETFTVALGTPVNGQLGTVVNQIVTITDNDPAPTLAFASAASSLGESAGPAQVAVTLSAPSGFAVSVPVTLVPGSAAATVDFGTATTPLVVPAGSAGASIAVPIVDDLDVEGDETFDVVLGTPTNAVLGSPSSHTVTILDDDLAPLTRGLALDPLGAALRAGGTVELGVDEPDADVAWTVEDPSRGAFLETGTATARGATVRLVAGADAGPLVVSAVDVTSGRSAFATLDVTPFGGSLRVAGTRVEPLEPAVRPLARSRDGSVGVLAAADGRRALGELEPRGTLVREWTLPRGLEAAPALVRSGGRTRVLARSQRGAVVLELDRGGALLGMQPLPWLSVDGIAAMVPGPHGELFFAGADGLTAAGAGGERLAFPHEPSLRGASDLAVDRDGRIFVVVDGREGEGASIRVLSALGQPVASFDRADGEPLRAPRLLSVDPFLRVEDRAQRPDGSTELRLLTTAPSDSAGDVVPGARAATERASALLLDEVRGDRAHRPVRR